MSSPPSPPWSVAVAYTARPRELDGIRDHSERLVEALAAHPAVAAADLRAIGPRGLPGPAPDAVVLQYNPFSYGRWGLAPWLPAALLALRRRRPRPVVAVMAHELFVPADDWRSGLMSAYQRAQLRAVLAGADIAFASIEAWAAALAARRGAPPVRHLPVGSNLPDRREARAAMRDRLGLGPGDLAISTLGTGHPGHVRGPVGDALALLAGRGAAPVLLNLGGGARPPEGLPASVRVMSPGMLDAGDLAAHLSAADLHVAAFLDGASTRRTSMVAALQHGVPVVGTEGRLTDSWLRGADAPRLVAAGELPAAVAALAADPAGLEALGRAGRLLHDERFAWPVIAGQMMDGLAHAASTRR